jgi:hypothetical protein
LRELAQDSKATRRAFVALEDDLLLFAVELDRRLTAEQSSASSPVEETALLSLQRKHDEMKDAFATQTTQLRELMRGEREEFELQSRRNDNQWQLERGRLTQQIAEVEAQVATLREQEQATRASLAQERDGFSADRLRDSQSLGRMLAEVRSLTQQTEAERDERAVSLRQSARQAAEARVRQANQLQQSVQQAKAHEALLARLEEQAEENASQRAARAAEKKELRAKLRHAALTEQALRRELTVAKETLEATTQSSVKLEQTNKRMRAALSGLRVNNHRLVKELQTVTALPKSKQERWAELYNERN